MGVRHDHVEAVLQETDEQMSGGAAAGPADLSGEGLTW